MPAATRKGDSTTGHGWYPTMSDEGSPTVFVNNKPTVRVGDHFTTHSLPYPPVAPHDSVSAQGSPTVFVENLAMMRIGDETSCSDKVSTGSPDVFVN